MEQIILFILSVVLFSSSFWFGITGSSAEMGIAIVGGSICMAFANIDKIQRFKGAGFEAEMKKAVNEIYVTIDIVRNIAKTSSIATFHLLRAIGRWGPPDHHQIIEIKNKLDSMCSELNIKDEEFSTASRGLFQRFAWDHLYLIKDFINKDRKLEKVPKESLINQLDSIINYKNSKLPSSKKIIEIIEPIKNQLSDEIYEKIQEAINDYNYYLDNKKLRREQTLKKE